jgi:hypothetical protein
MKITQRSLIIFVVLLVAVAAPVTGARAQSQIEPKAMDALQKMAKYLGSTKQFSVAIRDGYDVVQKAGQKVEFGETRKIIVSRPDDLRIDVEKSNGKNGSVFFNGKNIEVYLAGDNSYAMTEKEGSVDQAIKYAVGELGVQMPLALMLMSTLPSELQRRVVAADYVESTNIMGVPCDHIAARTAEGTDFQVWIEQGDSPLPRRIVITYYKDKGQPQFWADLNDWNLSPDITDATFAFTPPSDAERIQFLALVRGSESRKGDKK